MTLESGCDFPSLTGEVAGLELLTAVGAVAAITVYALVNQNNVNNVLRQWNREMGRYSRILGPPLDAQSRSSVHGALPEYDSTLPPRVAASKKRKKQQKAKKKLEAASAVQEPDTEARYSKEEMHAFAREYAKTVDSDATSR